MNPSLVRAHATSCRRLRRRASLPLALLIAAFVALTAPAVAQTTHVGAGTPLAKPAKHNSYVLASDGRWMWDDMTTFVGTNYPGTLTTFPGVSVDVVMQQCFGGGYAAGMDAALGTNTDYTFTSATNWNELAFNYQTYNAAPRGAATMSALNNFTRGWNESFPRPKGLYLHYGDAVSGAPAIVGPPAYGAVTPDPYGPSGPMRDIPNKSFENPSYASPDPTLLGFPVANAPNNGRDVVSANQYAVLVSWQHDNFRFDANINRIYASLVARGVPANHIVVLAPGANTLAIPVMGLAAVPVTGVASDKNFKDAISGALFAADARPNAESHLLVYNTGHGHNWDSSGAKGTATLPVNPGPPKKVKVVTKDALDMPANGFIDLDGGDSGVGVVDLQIATQTPLDVADLLSGVTVALNGMPLGNLSPSLTPFALTPMIGTSFYYDVQVPLSLINTLSPGSLTIDLDNMYSSNVYDSLVTALTFDAYGDTWSIGVDPVPEPATCILVVICLVAGLAIRKRP